jgi:hypothetical protein
MIRSIRISRDQFAAENHSAGGISIEIITQPGLGPIRYNTAFRFRGGSLSGRSPFTPVRGPEQMRNYMMGLNGALVQNKASFNLNVQGVDLPDAEHQCRARDRRRDPSGRCACARRATTSTSTPV